jgi:hypothetical protein
VNGSQLPDEPLLPPRPNGFWPAIADADLNQKIRRALCVIDEYVEVAIGIGRLPVSRRRHYMARLLAATYITTSYTDESGFLPESRAYTPCRFQDGKRTEKHMVARIGDVDILSGWQSFVGKRGS